MGNQKFIKRKHFDDDHPVKKKDTKRISLKGKKMILQARGEIFRCVHCKKEVPLDSLSTKHRNHCPYCLYSLHVDVTPGDRKSECHGSMIPIGLCLKQDGGELMVIHDCQKCGKLNINRISAEDSDDALMNVFSESLKLLPEVEERLAKAKITLLENEEKLKILLYGKKQA